MNIKISKSEMNQLHSDGKIEKDGVTIEFTNESKIQLDELVESYNEFIFEKRSDSSKIAKKAGTDKSTVEDIQDALDSLDSKSISKAIASKTKIDVKIVNKVIDNMKKIYGGDLQIRISS